MELYMGREITIGLILQIKRELHKLTNFTNHHLIWSLSLFKMQIGGRSLHGTVENRSFLLLELVQMIQYLRQCKCRRS